MKLSKLALFSGVLGGLALFDMLLGPALGHFGAVAPFVGFLVFVSGLLFGVLGLPLGLGGLRTTRAAAGRSGRGYALLGIAAGVVSVVAVGIAQAPGAGAPAINDITTDMNDPPAFASDPAERGRDMTYPAAFVAQVKATPGYADLQPLRIARAPEQVLADADATARSLGWLVVTTDPATGTLLARETTKIFAFADDVVVRVRSNGAGGSIVDVRSKSRDGKGDVGANAARIRRFFAALPK